MLLSRDLSAAVGEGLSRGTEKGHRARKPTVLCARKVHSRGLECSIAVAGIVAESFASVEVIAGHSLQFIWNAATFVAPQTTEQTDLEMLSLMGD